MAVIEIIAGLLVVAAVVLAIGAVVAGWDRMAAWRYRQTIVGSIERKREEIEEHARYMSDLRSRVSAPDTPQFRREILNNYLELAAKKRSAKARAASLRSRTGHKGIRREDEKRLVHE